MEKKRPKTIAEMRVVITLLGTILVVIIGAVDFYSAYELGLSAFYLISIYAVSWLAGRNPGVFIAIISAAIWNIMPLFSEGQYDRSFLTYSNMAVRMFLFIGTAMVIAKLKDKMILEQKHSRIDFMTGAGNVKSFYELAALELDRGKRYNHSFTTVYIDCDNFKQVNDSFGHKKGDELLRLIARTVRAVVRTTDIFARIGGDEFILLLIETNLDSSQKIVQRLRKRLLAEVKQNEFGVTFSFGVATFVNLPDGVDELLHKSDALMYEAKKQGKDIIVHEEIK